LRPRLYAYARYRRLRVIIGFRLLCKAGVDVKRKEARDLTSLLLSDFRVESGLRPHLYAA
jgi:hypothetical protein